MRGSSYHNAYFDLSVPLPPRWIEGLAGPPPSSIGTYVLTSFDGTKADAATILVVAQDLFFTAKPMADAAAVAADFRTATAAMPDMTIDAKPASVSIGGRAALRLNYDAGGLFRVWLATELRCHVITFNVTGTNRAKVDDIARDLNAMTLPTGAAPVSETPDAEHAFPTCIKDYVTPQTLIRKVDPIPVDYNGLPVAVRIIIGADGHVRHVHVISAGAAQRRAITEALMQWEFKPYEVAGRPGEVETGLIFEFKRPRP